MSFLPAVSCRSSQGGRVSAEARFPGTALGSGGLQPCCCHSPRCPPCEQQQAQGCWAQAWQATYRRCPLLNPACARPVGWAQGARTHHMVSAGSAQPMAPAPGARHWLRGLPPPRRFYPSPPGHGTCSLCSLTLPRSVTFPAAGVWPGGDPGRELGTSGCHSKGRGLGSIGCRAALGSARPDWPIGHSAGLAQAGVSVLFHHR